jgi:G3E family GTPase
VELARGDAPMKLLMVTGFFGAGKTTFIIKAAELFVRRYRQKVAIIVNDIGEIGIDNRVMNAFGLKVKELFGGCVCCQLGDDLVKTLRQVERRFAPDLTVLEASGAADPGQILSALSGAQNVALDLLPLIVMVDAPRFRLLRQEMPIVLRKVAYADGVLINKLDAVSKRELQDVVQGVKDLNHRARIYILAATEGRGVDAVVEALVSRPAGARKPSSAGGVTRSRP